MADFYCDVSAIGNEYQTYADTPTTWAVPQDGNGKAGPGHAAAVSVAEIDFAAVPTTGVISVYGVTVTLTGVLSAASTSAAATALASSINATVTATGATVCQLLLPLQKFVYARVKPSFPTVVQIMCRIAGADLNYAGNTTARVTNTFNNSAMASPVDFTGGADGPFGYIATGSTVFGKTVLTYGVWVSASSGPAEPTFTDTVHIRTKRSSSSLTAYVTSGNVSGSWTSRRFVYDDGTIWTGDNGVLTFTMSNTSGSAQTFSINMSLGNVSHVARTYPGLRVSVYGGTGSLAITSFCKVLATALRFSFVNCDFIEAAGTTARTISLITDLGGTYAGYHDLSGSSVTTQATAISLISFYGTLRVRLKLDGLRCTVVAATGSIGTFMRINGTGPRSIEWMGGYVADSLGVYTCDNPILASAASVATDIVMDGVQGVTDPSVGFTSVEQSNSRLVWTHPEGSAAGFRYETSQYIVDWRVGGTFPHCGVSNLQGLPWSHRITWTTLPSVSLAVTPLRLGLFYRGTAAIKTLTLELYVPDSNTIYNSELEFAVAYIDTSGVWRTEAKTSRGNLGTAQDSTLASSAKSWTANSAVNHSAKKLQLTTAYQIAQNSEVVCRLSICGTRGVSNIFYVSPEVGVS